MLSAGGIENAFSKAHMCFAPIALSLSFNILSLQLFSIIIRRNQQQYTFTNPMLEAMPFGCGDDSTRKLR